MHLRTIKITLSLLITLLFFSGCGGGSTSNTVESNLIQTSNNQKAIHQGQVKDSKTGNGLEDVNVTIGDNSTTTDKNGFYTFNNLEKRNTVTINFSKENYLLGSTQINLKLTSNDNTQSTNYLEYNLYSHDYQYNHTSKETISNSHINFDSDITYMDINNNPYTSAISVELSILEDTKKSLLSAFPGGFEGINTDGNKVQFETYGLISILLKDVKGNKLDFANEDTGTLIFKPISSLNQDTLSLWYYNYDKGLWIEEGYAELQNDGTYRGEISHLGTWSLSQSIENEPGIYRGRIIDNDGLAIDHVRLKAIGSNWMSKDLSTDENGFFEINVVPDSNFTLEAYDYKNKYSAKYANTIPSIASGEIIEN